LPEANPILHRSTSRCSPLVVICTWISL